MTTPRPWKQDGTYIIGAELTKDARVIAVLTQGHITPAPLLDIGSGEWSQGMEDCRLLLRAVNTFDAAREALRAVVDARWDYKWKNDRVNEWKSKMCDAVDKCELVLAQMEGKP